MSNFFASVDEVTRSLTDAGYLPSTDIATAVFLAGHLGKPLLIEGPAGVGKTELAKALAVTAAAELIRLQCYEGIDEARALYEWNHAKQLLRITATEGEGWDSTREHVFTEEFLLSRPLLAAIRNPEPTVLLIDELDKADVELEGLLLEVLGDYQVSIPELGTIRAVRKPFVILTSNANRELSEALKRRCLYLHIDYPTAELERAIVRLRVPELDAALAEPVVRTVGALRQLPLRKAPSVAETVDWARTLVALGTRRLTGGVVRSTLGVLLKHRSDHQVAVERLELDGADAAAESACG
ncbi:AAA family ATPase [Nocardia cyriacigeorgica]|uniref:AAA family ATPase n=1 Tax=Nocardia cyriacigeorgica TaxID=135487 RepID=UPI0018955FCF|nr:MoxR family ATPase [Nocardia cyriacigeorgica]MBF6456770.1 MoxR family ATPase [Nocardia cyriacigeorgica]MBF6476702.1 MoxR family ATPase [Nocardia cyriacigeorgica]MBF6551575.1 MoxR family ATPase [Nocardia cyriacigeorgica]